MRLLLPFCILALAGCAVVAPPPDIVVSPSHDWRIVATQSDRNRLREWRSAFVSALASARAAGHGQEIDAEGVLLQPDAAQPVIPMPEGAYRCRVIKLGARTPGMLAYVAYPWFNCRIQQEGRLLSFVKLTGSQRPAGRIYPGDAMRQVFLGTLMLGDEARAMQYGVDPERDVAGFVERIGPERWRLIMPLPHFESQMDVMELVPAS